MLARIAHGLFWLGRDLARAFRKYLSELPPAAP